MVNVNCSAELGQYLIAFSQYSFCYVIIACNDSLTNFTGILVVQEFQKITEHIFFHYLTVK